MATAKYMDTFTLRRLMSKDKSCNPSFKLNELDPDGYHVVIPLVAALNDRAEIRTEIMAKRKETSEPSRFLLDMTLADYNDLPEWSTERKEG
jgi:hypothetical protein